MLILTIIDCQETCLRFQSPQVIIFSLLKWPSLVMLFSWVHPTSMFRVLRSFNPDTTWYNILIWFYHVLPFYLEQVHWTQFQGVIWPYPGVLRPRSEWFCCQDMLLMEVSSFRRSCRRFQAHERCHFLGWKTSNDAEKKFRRLVFCMCFFFFLM